MSQSVVNFLVDILPGTGSTNLVVEPRIFDFEITSDARDLYASLINSITNNLVPGASDSDISDISNLLNTLNNWSKLRLVDNVGPDGAYVQTYQISLPGIGPVSVKLDADGKPLPPTEQGPPLDAILWTDGKPDAPASQPVPFNALSSTELALLLPVFSDSSLPGGQTNSTMDRYMAEGLDKLLRAFRSAGWDPIDQPAATSGAVTQAMRDAVAKLTGADAGLYGVVDVGTTKGLLSQAIGIALQARVIGLAAESQSQSIQQVLMVDYVSRGNELLFNEMTKLRQAIDLNQTALQYLNSLQDLMNQKDPERFVLQLEHLNDIIIGSDASRDAFDTYERLTYNETIDALAKFRTDGTLASYLTDPDVPVPGANAAFDALSPLLVQTAVYSKSRIMENLDYLIKQLAALSPTLPGAEEGLSLALTKVKNDFDALPTSPLSNPIKLWVQDASKGEEGDYQRHLNDAITGSQSFNDSQREELRRVMFTFEEFYKSATALLSRLTQLLEKIATSISR